MRCCENNKTFALLASSRFKNLAVTEGGAQLLQSNSIDLQVAKHLDQPERRWRKSTAARINSRLRPMMALGLRANQNKSR